MARFEIPDGWVVQAYRYALDPTPAQQRGLSSHAGAARFARNHMLGVVKATLGQRAAERTYGVTDDALTPSLGWSLPALRREWNQRKAVVAPWWAENSKEAYNTGLDSLARSLQAWLTSRTGQRAGASVGFPRFHSKRGRASVRFTTGAIRVEADRHHVTLPRLGTIRTHESTRKLARRIEAGARKRGLNRALADAALAQVRRMLAYKTIWHGSTLVEADRWYPSSKACSGCGGRKPRLLLAERTYNCDHCGLSLDRDLNAAINLARLGETHLLGESSPAGSGPVVGRGATCETEPAPAGDAAGDEASTPHHQSVGQTGTASPQGEAA